MKFIVLAAAASWYIYALLYNPRWIAVLFFTCVIADINFDLPIIPLNLRSFICLSLFIKIMSDPTPLPGKSFLKSSYSIYIISFVVYVLAITFMNDFLTVPMVKEFIFSLMGTYLAYYFCMKEGGYKLFRLGIVFAGFVCFADLAWTYAQGGGLWMQRIYYLFTPAYEYVNHNFFGYICAVAFVFLLADYLTENGNSKANLLMMPFMFFGVLLSTSRSSLLILVIISVVLIARGLLSHENSSKSYKLVVVSVSCLVLTLFLFQLLSAAFNISSEFLEQITGRLINEPLAILDRALGNSYDPNSLDSMDWRAEASEIAYHTFVDILTPAEQIFGIGNDGFMGRNYGYNGTYAAHNGILLMLIEYGVVGFVFYHIMLISLVVRSFKLKYLSPLAVCVVFIFLYVTSHNREMTSFLALLVIGTLAAEVEYGTNLSEEEEENENEITAATA